MALARKARKTSAARLKDPRRILGAADRERVEDFLRTVTNVVEMRSLIDEHIDRDGNPPMLLLLRNLMDKELLKAATRSGASAPWNKAWRLCLDVERRNTFEVLSRLIEEWHHHGKVLSRVSKEAVASAADRLGVAEAKLRRHFEPDAEEPLPRGTAEAAKWLMAKAQRQGERAVGKQLQRWIPLSAEAFAKKRKRRLEPV